MQSSTHSNASSTPGCSCCALLCSLSEWMKACPLRTATLQELGKRVHRSPLRNGKEVSKEIAIELAQEWLGQSKFPLVSGPIVDVESSRAAIRLASHYQAAIDVSESQTLFDTLTVLQTDGMVSTTFAELVQHCDCLIVIGNDTLLDRYPQLTLQILPRDSQLADRKLLLVGKWSDQAYQQFADCHDQVLRYESDLSRLPLGMGELDRYTSEPESLLGNSKNVVALWSDDCLPSISARDLWIQAWNRWAKNPLQNRRRAILPLGSLKSTFTQVCTWTTGFPGRIRFRADQPQYDVDQYDADRLLNSQAIDLLVWVNSSSHQESPVGSKIDRMISISPFPPVADGADDWLWLPAAIPGIDDRSIFFRADQAVSFAIGPSRDETGKSQESQYRISNLIASMIR